MQKIILGTVQFGLNYGINNPAGKPTMDKALEILSFAQSNGINTLDTAEGYGNAIEIIGSYHHSHPHFKVISKFSTDNDIEADCIASLKKAGVQLFEAYLFHSFNNFLSAKKTALPVLSRLKAAGSINKIGVSLYNNEELETAINTPEID